MKESVYNVYFESNGDKYVYNTRYNGIARIDSYDILHNKDYHQELIEEGYLVNSNTDEVEELIGEINNRILNDYFNLDLTLLITEKCNFKCIYCYQNPGAIDLDIENADKILKFVKDAILRYGYKELNINYFGGEPLLNEKILLYLDEGFKTISEGMDILYNSYVTTNGSLITPELCKKVNFDNIQITIEGMQEVHNNMRKSTNNKFNDIINSIDRIIEYCDKITFRINLCEQNKRDLIPLINFLTYRYDDYVNKISFHIDQMIKYSDNAPFDMLSFEEYSRLYMEAIKQIAKNGKNTLLPVSSPYPCPFLVGISLSINPNLNLSYCTGSDSQIEKTFSFETLDRREIYEVETKCKKCKVLPICLGGCNVKKDMNYIECIPEKLVLEDMLINYLSNL